MYFLYDNSCRRDKLIVRMTYLYAWQLSSENFSTFLGKLTKSLRLIAMLSGLVLIYIQNNHLLIIVPYSVHSTMNNKINCSFT